MAEHELVISADGERPSRAAADAFSSVLQNPIKPADWLMRNHDDETQRDCNAIANEASSIRRSGNDGQTTSISRQRPGGINVTSRTPGEEKKSLGIRPTEDCYPSKVSDAYSSRRKQEDHPIVVKSMNEAIGH